MFSYELNGGTILKGSNPTEYNINDSIKLIEPNREGDTFHGWLMRVNGTSSLSNSIAKGTTGDITFIAIWESSKDIFKVEYISNNGDGTIGTSIKLKGESIKISSASALSRTGYAFTCWNTNADGTGNDYKPGDSYSNDENLTLYAKWTPITYQISYDLDGGTLSSSNPNSLSAKLLPVSPIFPLVSLSIKVAIRIMERWMTAGISSFCHPPL